MLEYLDRHPEINAIFSFVERGQPGGQKRELWLLWTEINGCSWGDVKAGDFPGETKPTALRLEDVQQVLQKHGFAKLRDNIGNVRDGTHYTVAFCDRHYKCRLVKIWSPQPETAHGKLVDDL